MATRKKTKKKAKKKATRKEPILGADLRERELGKCPLRGCRRESADVLLFGLEPLPFCREHFETIKPWISKVYFTIPPDLLEKNRSDLSKISSELAALRRELSPFASLVRAARDLFRPDLSTDDDDDGRDPWEV